MSGVEIPLAAPSVDDDDRRLVAEVMNGSALSRGPFVERFEALLAAAADRRHAVAVSSGTAALHLIVRALGWRAGDEVVTTPFSFVASTNCLLYEGVRPVFVDIDPRTYCLDPAAVAAAVTPRTVGILSVDVFGFPADWAGLSDVASRHGLALISDACESLGASRQIDGRRVPAGKAGTAAAFAFYANKQITTGEGGAIVTDDERLARFCRVLRNQGREPGAGWLEHAHLGYNYRLPELNAALGASQATRLSDIVARRRSVAQRYLDLLPGLHPLVLPPPGDPAAEVSWFAFVVRLANELTAADRDAVLDGLREHGVGCANYFAPIHLQPYAREHLGCGPGDFPIAERLGQRTVALPFFTALDGTSQGIVIAALGREVQAAARSPLIRAARAG